MMVRRLSASAWAALAAASSTDGDLPPAEQGELPPAIQAGSAQLWLHARH